MKISAIVSCYNCESYISDAINSIINQTVKVDEIIVINDGSTDDSLNVLNIFRDKIRLFTQENKGLYETLNFGIKQSTGDFVAFLDSDDTWELDKIERQVRDKNNNPSFSIFAGRVRQFVSPEIQNHNYSFVEYPKNSLMKITLLVKKDLFHDGGWFKEANSSTDFPEWVDYVKSKGENIFYSEYILANRRLRPNSLSQTKNHYPSLLSFLKRRIDSKRQNEKK